MITAIVAHDEKYGIATDNGIPWDIPQDRRYFKLKTINFWYEHWHKNS